ncbi:hypothetical protein [Enterovibrio nigricans]|nr:hypothetical protein [Enterovibrio nigricans]
MLFSIMTISACSTNENMPLIFSQTQSVGIGIGTNAVAQGVDFSLGYKDSNIAIIPITIKQSSNDSTLIKSTVGNSQDAMSVLGQFDVNSNNEGAGAALGKFFATGIAAQQLATGFKNSFSSERSNNE